MKITNQQIEALVNKISKDLKNAYDAKIKTLEKTPKFINAVEAEMKKYKPALDLISKGLILSFEIKRYSDVHNKENLYDLIVVDLIREFTKDYKKIPSNNDIRNEILISTIECENIETLINQIKEKFI